MIGTLDRFIDRITMYRLVLWYLVALVVATLLLGLLHLVAVDPVALALSSVLVLAGGWISNQLFARVFDAVPNIESVYITGLIIVLIMDLKAQDIMADKPGRSFSSAGPNTRSAVGDLRAQRAPVDIAAAAEVVGERRIGRARSAGRFVGSWGHCLRGRLGYGIKVYLLLATAPHLQPSGNRRRTAGIAA